MKRTVKFGIVGLAVAATVAVGATALARGAAGWHPGMMKAKVSEHIDGALEAAHATPAQRETILAARDRVFAAFEETHQDRGARMARALALFESDTIDPAAVGALRDEHRATAQKVGDALVQAVTEAHDVLSPEQRRAVVEYARSHEPPTGHLPQHAGFFKRMASHRIDAALDAAKVDDSQRARIDAARDRVFAAFEAERPDPGAHFDEALSLFAADTIDQAKVAALRAQHQEVAQRVGDAVVGALQEAHDVLSPAQRRAVVEFVRARHAEHVAE